MRIQTADLTPDTILDPDTNDQVYCGLDSCVTLECFNKLETLGRPPIYDFMRELQAPYLEVMLRGFAVDELSRRRVAQQLNERLDKLRRRLDRYAFAVWDKPICGPKSFYSGTLQAFFYGAMKLPEVWINDKGTKRLSCNREALEKLDAYIHARPFVQGILRVRELNKQLEVFEDEIDSDGRYRTSYNIAGTSVGRPSSSENSLGTGGDLQNIPPRLRHVFVADPGKKLGQIDLEQTEARDVGFLCGILFDDWSFLDACESGDFHTNNAKLIWPELPWTGDPKVDRAIADRIYYRDFSYRDMSKRGGHLSNYMGTAYTAARHLKVPLPIMEEFQARYCRGRAEKTVHGILIPEIIPAYTCIPRYWQWITEQLQTVGEITSPFGRKRRFFGRPDDDAVKRKAIAALPQQMTADRMNLGFWRVWKKMPQVELLAQTFDSITFQYEDRGTEYENDVVQQALELTRVPLYAPNGREFIVPGEAKVGWNWGYYTEQKDVDRALKDGKTPPVLNPAGLRKWNLNGDMRSRPANGLQRIMMQ